MKQNCIVPAFLSKLWTLVDDQSTNDLICWSQNGCSFIVCHEQRFSKDILPLYFKHSNMTSFVRQLNMYGFHKVVQVEAGLPRGDGRTESVEFRHPHFHRTQQHLLELIRRKVSVSRCSDEGVVQVSQVLLELAQVRGWQEASDSKLMALRRENESLWREVDALRQRQQQQHKIIRKIIQFIITTVQSNGITGFKRKFPFIDSSGLPHSPPKCSRSISMEKEQPESNLQDIKKCIHLMEMDSFNNGSIYSKTMDITQLLGLQTGSLKHNKPHISESLCEISSELPHSAPATLSVDLDLSLVEDPVAHDGVKNGTGSCEDKSDRCDPMALIDSSIAAIQSSVPLSPAPGLDLLSELLSPVACSADTETDTQVVEEEVKEGNEQQTVASFDWDSQQAEPQEEDEEEVTESCDILPTLLQLAEEVSDFDFTATLVSDPLALM